jgi:hypothetical protein
MICSALDVVGDTQAAIAAYEDFDATQDFGRAYLLTYGLLHTLYLQQDAIRHIYEALRLPYTAPPELKKIRQIRNEAVGHPTSISRGEAFAFIVRMCIDEHGFDYHVSSADRTFRSETVSLRDLVHKQREVVFGLLLTVANELHQEWLVFMKKYAAVKLASLLPDTWQYYVGNISKAIEGNGLGLGDMHVQLLLEPLDTISRALAERHESSMTLGLSLPQLRHALVRLSEYFTDRDGPLNQDDAWVYFGFAANQLKELEKFLENLDDEYEEAATEG